MASVWGRQSRADPQSKPSSPLTFLKSVETKVQKQVFWGCEKATGYVTIVPKVTPLKEQRCLSPNQENHPLTARGSQTVD